MGVQYVDAVTIVLLSLAANLLSEGISWFFVYRLDTFKNSKHRILDLTKKMRKEEATTVGLEKRKAQEKKIQKYQEDIKRATAQLNGSKLKVNICISLFLMLVYRFVSFLFYGKVVATLPFDPITFLRGMTHRGIEGDNYYECSFAFIYALCTMAIKGSLQKGLGFAAPRPTFGIAESMENSNVFK